MSKLRRILFATDFSEASTPALRQAISMSRESGAELLIAHAYHVPTVGLPESPELYDDWDRRLRADAETRLGALVAEAAREGVKAVPLVLFGFPDDVLVQAAKDRAADLMVLGTHGRRGVPRLFLGSVASRVIATAPCPVLTVRGV